jgi:hypothetical protein
MLELQRVSQELSERVERAESEAEEWKKQHAQLKLLLEVEKESHEMLKMRHH